MQALPEIRDQLQRALRTGAPADFAAAATAAIAAIVPMTDNRYFRRTVESVLPALERVFCVTFSACESARKEMTEFVDRLAALQRCGSTAEALASARPVLERQHEMAVRAMTSA